MALPASGQISMDNMNTDRGINSGTQIDLDTAAIAYSIPTKPHGMDEFYGLSIAPVYTSYSSSQVAGAQASTCGNPTSPAGSDNYVDFTITLLDQFSSPINAISSQDFTITYDYNDVQDVGGGSYPGSTIILTVNGGSSSGTLRFYTKQYVNCNFSSLCDGSCYNESTQMVVSSGPN